MMGDFNKWTVSGAIVAGILFGTVTYLCKPDVLDPGLLSIGCGLAIFAMVMWCIAI